jgi:hypothetical protein
METKAGITVSTAMGWIAEVRFPERAKDFSLLLRAQASYGAYPASYPMSTEALSQGARLPKCETDHSLPSSADVKNEITLHFPVRLYGLVLN